MKQFDESKTKFCHYTSVDVARRIIETNSFQLSKMSNMNDKTEAKIHQYDDNRLFTMCFSHSEAKSIPMFYLYSGIDGKGCRLELTGTKIRSLMQGAIHPVNKRYIKLTKTYSPDEYDVLCDWIYYKADNEDVYYRGRWYRGNDANALQNDDANLFVKKPYWSYESEFRIMVRFKENIKYERIAIDFDFLKNKEGVSMMFGPELSESEYSELSNEFREYDIKNCRMFTGNKISMDLIARNKALLKG